MINRGLKFRKWRKIDRLLRIGNVRFAGVAPLGAGQSLHRSLVVAFAEIFFQPDVKTDEQVPAPHLFDLKFGDAGPAVSPADGDHGPGITANYGLQREFDGKIEMRR